VIDTKAHGRLMAIGKEFDGSFGRFAMSAPTLT